MASGSGFLFGQEGREHTAQVDQERRQWREWRFRWGAEDQQRLTEAKDVMRQAGEPGVPLPALFCSPTMELGVDISALNAVYLRNMPPTPANYAQRSGRAGRSGQAALVVAYCAAQSPHDQYYFKRRGAMVSGIVRPPAIELANRDLVRAHLHAIWLAESGKELAADIPHVLDLSKETLTIQEEIADAFAAPDLKTRSAAAMKHVLDSIDAELTPEAAPWAIDREAFATATADAAAREFSGAFDRWRQLYDGARDQLREANRKSEMHGLSAKERRAAKNKDERTGQGDFDFAKGGGRLPAPTPLAAAARALRVMPEDNAEEIAAKHRRFAAGRADPRLWAFQIAADLYTAAFLMSKTGGVPTNRNTVTAPTTAHVWEALAGHTIYGPLVGRAQDLTSAAHAFH